MKKTFLLKNTMNMFYTLAVVIPLIIISLLAMYFSSFYFIDLSKDYNNLVIQNIKLNIDSFFEEPVYDFNALTVLLKYSDSDEEEIIKNAYESQRLFDHILIIDKDGAVNYSYPKNEGIIGFDYSKEETVEKIFNGADLAWSSTYIYSREDLPSVNFSVPYGDKVLLGVIHLDNAKAIFEKTIDHTHLTVGITNQNGMYIMHSNYENVERRAYDPQIMKQDLNYTKVKINNKSFYATSTDIDHQDWKVIVYEPTIHLQNRIFEFMMYLSAFIVVMLIVVVLLGFRFNTIIIKNLNTVIERTKEVRAGKYGLTSIESIFKEFNVIGQNFTAMTYEIKSREDQILAQKYEIESMNKDLEHRVIERTNELFSANQELEIALENLKMTQNQLIESEKLASLGDLVAGLAHEINTPLGIILTITSYMQETTKKVKESYDTGMLKKSDFEQHLNTTADSEALVFDNVTRAIELISSFKLISAEQRNMEKKEVDLVEFMDSIIRSVNPQLKKSHIETVLHIPDGIAITTVPISLYQIVVNLVMNAKVHAYDSSGGTVDIFVNEVKSGIEIIVQDYGCGISDENLKKIFEPFFTTKRGSGGTGLGLNIVYNTVKQNLKGDIRCFSEIGVGSQFVIRLPKSI